MRRLLIIARREYLSYVATWGFWISLAMVPVFIAVASGLPALLNQSAPERAFTVVTQEPRVIDAVDALLAERRAGNAEDRLEAPGRNAARQARRQYVRVPAPAETETALRPYLTGEAPVPGWEGRGPLHAAAFVRRGAGGLYEIDYWSANLTDQNLRRAVADAVGRLMRDDVLAEAGVDPAVVDRAARLRPTVRDLSPEKEAGAEEVTLSDRLPLIIGLGAGFVLWTAIFSVANMLLTSTIEEKSNKVLEVLLSSARLPEILGGKLLGVAGVSFTLLGVWLATGLGLFGLAAAAAPDAMGPAADIAASLARPELLAAFVFYFVGGYLIYGAIFLAIGALCETMQEAQTLMSPLILILMAPIFLLGTSFSNMDSPFISAAVWVPLFTPFLMMARLPQDPPLWEVLGTAALMMVTVVALIWAGSRVFRAGALGQARPGSILKAFRKA